MGGLCSQSAGLEEQTIGQAGREYRLTSKEIVEKVQIRPMNNEETFFFA